MGSNKRAAERKASKGINRRFTQTREQQSAGRIAQIVDCGIWIKMPRPVE